MRSKFVLQVANKAEKWKDGYYSTKRSRFFNQQLLPLLKLKTPELVFHSLRHNFKYALRNAAIAPETQNRAIGHKTGHVGEAYGTGQLVEKSLELLRIRHKGLDLSHLYSDQPRNALNLPTLSV